MEYKPTRRRFGNGESRRAQKIYLVTWGCITFSMRTVQKTNNWCWLCIPNEQPCGFGFHSLLTGSSLLLFLRQARMQLSEQSIPIPKATFRHQLHVQRFTMQHASDIMATDRWIWFYVTRFCHRTTRTHIHQTLFLWRVWLARIVTYMIWYFKVLAWNRFFGSTRQR